MSKPTVIYTIMPDYGGAYGWVLDDGDESRGVGPNHADSAGWHGMHEISRELHEAFALWQGMFEAAPGLDSGVVDLDWAAFHTRGVELARRLKAEIGDAARVVYEKPFEDPERLKDERREVLADGTLLLLPSREDVFRVRLSRLVARIVSGGQTGADRAALDWAIARGIPHGGWCPPEREAEDGPIPARYELTEALTGGYRRRTRLNVEASDGTLILNLGELEGGTLETQRFAQELKKPHLVVQLDGAVLSELTIATIRWLRGYAIRRLNVAGPRESKRPGIYAMATAFLDALDQGYDPPRRADAKAGED